jgi:hypothetical protein
MLVYYASLIIHNYCMDKLVLGHKHSVQYLEHASLFSFSFEQM